MVSPNAEFFNFQPCGYTFQVNHFMLITFIFFKGVIIVDSINYKGNKSLSLIKLSRFNVSLFANKAKHIILRTAFAVRYSRSYQKILSILDQFCTLVNELK